MTPQLSTRYVFSLAILVGAPIVAGDTGYGIRRIIPILGGEVRGQGIKGTIFPVGADFQTIRPNGLTELEAKYGFEMDDGASTSKTSASASVRKSCSTASLKARSSIPR